MRSFGNILAIYSLCFIFIGCARGMIPVAGAGAVVGGLHYFCRENRNAYERDRISAVYKTSFADFSRAVQDIVSESQNGFIQGVNYGVLGDDTVSPNSRTLVLEDNRGLFRVSWSASDSQAVSVSLGLIRPPHCVLSSSEDYSIYISRDRFFSILQRKLYNRGIYMRR